MCDARERVSFNYTQAGLRLVAQGFGQGEIGLASVVAGVESDVIRRADEFPNVADSYVS